MARVDLSARAPAFSPTTACLPTVQEGMQGSRE